MGKLRRKLSLEGSNFIQQATLEKLKCSNCQKYLSVLPVFKNDNGDAICGRCPVNNNSNFVEDKLYEAAVELQRFPCTYRGSGCLENLFPSQLGEHEQRCPYMKYECPTKVYNNCTWKGPLSELISHFQNKHTVFILKHEFEVDFINNHNENYVMPCEDDIFVVTREGNSAAKTYSIIVKYLGSKTDMNASKCELTLTSGNKGFKYSIEEQIGKKVEITRETLKEKLHDPITVTAGIKIIYPNLLNKASSINYEDDDDDDNDGIDIEQLMELECPVCFEYMVPPIYQCETGHSLCKPCKDTQSKCPTCPSSFQKTQNFALERIVMNMIYPCKHKIRGCKHKEKAKFIRNHEASCIFGPFQCPLKDYENCSEEFIFTKLFDHIKTAHSESLYELDINNIPFDVSLNEDLSEAYILKYSQNLFKICFLYNHQEKKFFWEVQFVGPIEESSKYSFELEIIDQNRKNKRFYLKSNCAPLSNMSETFHNLDNYVYLHLDQISNFIKNQLTYRMIIKYNI